jgi:hypothetical protein
MLVAKKMRSFQEPVASQNGLVPGPRPKQRRVIANTQGNRRANASAARRGPAARQNLPYDRIFTQGFAFHSNSVERTLFSCLNTVYPPVLGRSLASFWNELADLAQKFAPTPVPSDRGQVCTA